MGFGARLVLATHNRGKLDEFERLFGGLSVELLTAPDLELAAPPETGGTYRRNARIKALAAFEATGLPALADDTGIEIDAMGGRPGVETADFAKRHGGWPGAHEAIADRTGLRFGITSVRATAVCAMTLARSRMALTEVQCRVRGQLHWPPDEALPGFAAIFETRPPMRPFAEDGVLLHRRGAFARLAAASRVLR